MRPMEHSTTSRPTGTAPEDTSTGTTDRGPGTPHYTRHFQSLILPGLAKGPILPEWLRRLFRRKATPAAR